MVSNRALLRYIVILINNRVLVRRQHVRIVVGRTTRLIRHPISEIILLVIHGCWKDVRRIVGMCLFRILLHRRVHCTCFLVLLVNALQVRLELVWYRLVDAHFEIPTKEEAVKMNGETRLRSATKDTYLKFYGPLSYGVLIGL